MRVREICLIFVLLLTYTGCLIGEKRTESTILPAPSYITEVKIITNSSVIFAGEKFSLPTTGTAIKSDKSKETIEIKWDKTINTLTAGIYEFIGKIESFEGQVRYTLIIKPIEITSLKLQEEKLTIISGTSFNITTTAIAYKNNNTTEIVQVIWDKMPDNITEGTKEYIGSVIGTTIKVKFTLNVLRAIIKSATLNEMSSKVFCGEHFTLPKTATVMKSDGSNEVGEIIWDREPDTTKDGVYEFTGTIKNSDIKLKFTLTVVKIEIISANTEFSSATIYQEDNFVLPTTATAIKNNNTRETIAILWDKSVNNKVEGNFEYTGSIANSSVKVKFVLTILKLDIVSVEVEKTSASIFQNDLFQLPITAYAVKNNGKKEIVDVVWDKSVDTKTEGIFNFTGSIKNTNLKVKFVLTVKKVEIVTAILNTTSSTIYKGETFSLPLTASAIMNNKTTETVSIVWDKNVNSYIEGTTELIGTIKNSSIKVKFSLKVIPMVFEELYKISIITSNTAYSNSGKKIAVGNSFGEIDVYNFPELTLDYKIKGDSKRISVLTFNKDDNKIVSGSEEGIIDLWDLGTKQKIKSWRGHEDVIKAVSLDTSETKIISGSWDDTVKIWNISSGELLKTIPAHVSNYTSVVLTSDKKNIVYSNYDNVIKIYSIEKGTELLSISGHTDYITSLALNQDGTQLLSGSWDNTIRTWDITTGKSLKSFDTYSDVLMVKYNYIGKKIVGINSDNTISLFDTEKFTYLKTLSSATMSDILISSDGSKISGLTYDGKLKVLNSDTGVVENTLSKYIKGITTVWIDNDGKRIICGNWDNTMNILDITNGKILSQVSGHLEGFKAVGFSNDSKYMVSGNNVNEVEIWEIESGNILAKLPGHTADIISIGFSGDGRKIVSASSSGVIVFGLK